MIKALKAWWNGKPRRSRARRMTLTILVDSRIAWAAHRRGADIVAEAILDAAPAYDKAWFCSVLGGIAGLRKGRVYYACRSIPADLLRLNAAMETWGPNVIRGNRHFTLTFERKIR